VLHNPARAACLRIEASLREFTASAAIEVRIWLPPHYDFIPPPMRYLLIFRRISMLFAQV
jgi:hypothetical protein